MELEDYKKLKVGDIIISDGEECVVTQLVHEYNSMYYKWHGFEMLSPYLNVEVKKKR